MAELTELADRMDRTVTPVDYMCMNCEGLGTIKETYAKPNSNPHFAAQEFFGDIGCEVCHGRGFITLYKLGGFITGKGE